MTYDEKGIPISAKCSACGEQMLQCVPRRLDPIDGIAWFAAQLRLHIEQNHLQAWTGGSSVQ
jgi:hypothetical protein